MKTTISLRGQRWSRWQVEKLAREMEAMSRDGARIVVAFNFAWVELVLLATIIAVCVVVLCVRFL